MIVLNERIKLLKYKLSSPENSHICISAGFSSVRLCAIRKGIMTPGLVCIGTISHEFSSSLQTFDRRALVCHILRKEKK